MNNQHTIINNEDTVSIKRDEFIGICHKLMTENEKWDSQAYLSAMDQFNLLRSMSKSKPAWFHAYSNNLYFFACVTFILYTFKTAAEAYFGRH